jgi:dTDP-4-amino-4,6-dideoxygalactose transaminase
VAAVRATPILAGDRVNALRVPFADPGRAARAECTELTAAFERVIAHGRFVLDEEVRSFEAEFAAACGQPHVAAVATGTDAIELALRALGVGPGDEVVTQANTCVPTIAAIWRTGAVPVLCDADATAAMDVESAAAAISPATRVLLPVHLYGHCVDMPALCALADEHGLRVVGDCAHALGATLDGRAAASFGALAAFSFYPTKQLAALGDAGAVASGDAELAARVRELRSYGSDRPGVNSRMDELQAAVLRGRLGRLVAEHSRREMLARRYDEAFADTFARPLPRHPNRRHALHLYVVEVERREAFRAALAQAGIATGVHYSPSLNAHPAWRDVVRTPVPLPVAERLAGAVVSLPLFPALRDEEQAAVIAAVLDCQLS